MALNRLGLLIHLTIHPVMPVRRDADGMLEAVLDAATGDGGEATFESFMHVEVDRAERCRSGWRRSAPSSSARSATCAPRSRTGRPMLGKIDTALADLKNGAKVIDADGPRGGGGVPGVDRRQSLHLPRLRLLRPGPRPGRRSAAPASRARRSACCAGRVRRAPTSRSFAALPPEIRRRARDPAPLVITKANARSTVHRPVYLDFIGVQRFDAKGKVVGEHRFLGLFTSAAYNRNPRHIPLLRHKVERVMQRANLPPAGHSGKALANILETYPRDELFQMSEDELFEVAQEILHLQERQKIRLFLRRDPFARFVSCLVYVPRERYNTEIRRRFQEILQQALGGTEVEYQAQVSESILARIQFIVRTPATASPPRSIPPSSRRA